MGWVFFFGGGGGSGVVAGATAFGKQVGVFKSASRLHSFFSFF